MSLEAQLERVLASLRSQAPRRQRAPLRDGTRAEMEHAKTIKRIRRNPKMPVREAAELIARDHLKEDPAYYEKIKALKEPRHTKKLRSPRLRLLRRIAKIKVYLVSATAVRAMTHKLPSAPDYTMGSHWGVWPEIIPRNEIWIADELGPPRDPLELNLTTLHEAAEVRRMLKDGLTYEDAHEESLQLEDYYRKRGGRGLLAAIRAESAKWRRRS